MRCILIFDNLNDILFSKYDKKFSRHFHKLAKLQGLIPENDKNEDQTTISNNILIQLFSPVVTSQQIMTSQFGNSYTSIQCFDGTNLVFDEYMGHLFVHVGYEDIACLKRMLCVCICIVQHLCGPDVSDLKHNLRQSSLLSHLLDTWNQLADSDQACLVEAVEQLTVNPEVNATVIKSLREAANKLKSMVDYSRSHALIFVENKFLSLYSSRDAEDLAAADILFLNILTESFRRPPPPPPPPVPEPDSDEGDSSDEYYSPPSSPSRSAPTSERDEDCIERELVILSGNGNYSPHAVHISTLSDGVSLLLLYQTSSEALCGGLNDAFAGLVMVENIQITENGEEGIRKVMEILDGSMKRIFDSLKKNKNQNTPQIETVTKQLHSKWDQLRKKFQEVLKEKEGALGIDALSANLHVLLRTLLRLTCLDRTGLERGSEAAELVTQQVRASLTDFTAFLKVKAIRNFSLGSRTSLTINKYLEEFPGLVHFLYIDRTNHRVTAPSLDFSSEETVTLTKKKIWSMVEFSRTHLQDGHLAVMWKDTTFNYAYYLWFEDNTGSPIKPKVCPSTAVKTLPMPGIICGDFYRKLVEACFPKLAASKVRCYELYCIHLGLATSSCVLEHSRRLAATIFEVTGQPNPLDIL
ncbi:hybrid polyketide synthetase [Homalodisca vitripennis]|nr:hybrid polyketide synthetase [Homalodisca vitripennis]